MFALMTVLMTGAVGAQERIVHGFSDADAAEAYVRGVVIQQPCGTAKSALDAALEEHGIPADIQTGFQGYQLLWIKPTGYLVMSMYNQSRSSLYEICATRYIFKEDE